MILLYINESELPKIRNWLNTLGYRNDEDYIWYRANGREDQYAFICYNTKLETLLALKYT